MPRLFGSMIDDAAAVTARVGTASVYDSDSLDAEAHDVIAVEVRIGREYVTTSVLSPAAARALAAALIAAADDADARTGTPVLLDADGEPYTETCRTHGEQLVTESVGFTGYAGGSCFADTLACGCTIVDESDDVRAAE